MRARENSIYIVHIRAPIASLDSTQLNSTSRDGVMMITKHFTEYENHSKEN